MTSGGLSAFAAGDLAPLARAFTGAAGIGAPHLGLPAPGVLELRLAGAPQARLALSVGVHGDETAPIELLYALLANLAASGATLTCDLLILVGDPAAIAAGRRFIETDLNRLFRRDAPLAGVEGARAAVLRARLQEFFACGDAPALHLDLHSTIKPSLVPQFAVIPARAEAPGQAWLGSWLTAAGIGVAIHNTLPAGTCSSFTATVCGATSATLELGTVGVLGGNDLGPLAPVAAALQRLLCNGPNWFTGGKPPQRFAVSQEIIRRSERFLLHLPPGAPNFSSFRKGELIAEDDAGRYVAQRESEHIVFPNAGVALWQRAGLMVYPIEGPV